MLQVTQHFLETVSTEIFLNCRHSPWRQTITSDSVNPEFLHAPFLNLFLNFKGQEGFFLQICRYNFPHADSIFLCSSLIWKPMINVFMLAQRTHEHLKASAVCRPILATSFLTGEMFFLLDQLFQRLLFMWWIAEEHQLLRRQFDFPL